MGIEKVSRAGAEALAELRASALRAIGNGRLEWRASALGALSARVRHGKHSDALLTVWSPRLLVPGVYYAGACHGLQHSAVTVVLSGALQVASVDATADERGTHEAYAGDSPARRVDGERYRLARTARTYEAGDCYELTRGALHEPVTISEVAITWTEAYGHREELARTLAPVGVAPVPMYTGRPNGPLAARILRDAASELRGDLEAMGVRCA